MHRVRTYHYLEIGILLDILTEFFGAKFGERSSHTVFHAVSLLYTTLTQRLSSYRFPAVLRLGLRITSESSASAILEKSKG